MPEASYNPASSELHLAFAEDKYTKKVNYTKFSRTIGSSVTLINYNVTELDRSITELEGTQGVLN